MGHDTSFPIPRRLGNMDYVQGYSSLYGTVVELNADFMSACLVNRHTVEVYNVFCENKGGVRVVFGSNRSIFFEGCLSDLSAIRSSDGEFDDFEIFVP